jgi:hypothetical protein
MNIEKVYVSVIKNAMFGMRLPHDSEKLSDSAENKIGEEDLKLLKKLIKAGAEHRKALRMIHIQALVTMPMNWWIQFDTYKVATVANSRSRMHRLGKRLLTKDDFYITTWTEEMNIIFEGINKRINIFMKSQESSEKTKIWFEILDILPMSYQQERMIDFNYETLLIILKTRYNEKLKNEWRFFCNTFINNCPNITEILENF